MFAHYHAVTNSEFGLDVEDYLVGELSNSSIHLLICLFLIDYSFGVATRQVCWIGFHLLDLNLL